MFDLIADDPLPREAARVAGLGGAVSTWGQLRRVLSDPGVPIQVVDAVWGWLIERSRVEESDAAMLCVGMAVPMLAGMASTFGPRRVEDRADVESDLLTAFFTELARVDLDRPFLWFRLRWAVFRGGRAWVRQEAAAPAPGPDIGTDLNAGWGKPVPAMWSPPGHPEDLLAEAVAEKVITAQVAELIAATRLEGRSVTSLAEEVEGSSHWALHKARRRGEHDLRTWLAARTAGSDLERTSIVEHRALHDLACTDDHQSTDLVTQLRLTDRDLQLLRLIDTLGGLTAAHVGEQLFPSVDTARKRLTALTRRGVLTRVRTRPSPGLRGVPPWHYTLSPLGTEITSTDRRTASTAAAHRTPERSQRRPRTTSADVRQPAARIGAARELPDAAESKTGPQSGSSQCGRKSAAPAHSPTPVEVNRRCA
ncbi:replication-relaxation family protein [Nocardia carnea]|uniref:replication-relaxation family protein n=1 Tax=Nocardia carnea TaxID=37328 RepID=UPI002457A26F|nr:replication-relaxation family protein [Nocardia carnea]